MPKFRTCVYIMCVYRRMPKCQNGVYKYANMTRVEECQMCVYRKNAKWSKTVGLDSFTKI